MVWAIGRATPSPADEVVILSLTVASLLALMLALASRLLRLHLLSRLAEQVTFVLIPPMVLIFLVLGTIFLGVATPTEGGAMGAVGALVMAVARRRLSFAMLRQALDSTARLATFVMFILIGSTVFSFTFNAADGHIWVEHLFDKLPGGALGFLIIVNLLVFVLGFFIDFFEIAFIVIPILAPVAANTLPELLPGVPVDAVMIWFGVIIAMNLQTSFLTPPFGFALFYLRSVAASSDYDDRVTGARIPAVTTGQIYKGAIAFIVLQVVMVASIIAWPRLVIGGLDEGSKLDAESVLEQLRMPERTPREAPAPPAGAPGADAGAPPTRAPAEDPNQAILDALKRDRDAAAAAASAAKK
jgi:TRAP-type mannitol/chloroaromatic compound transport system permease large subunit